MPSSLHNIPGALPIGVAADQMKKAKWRYQKFVTATSFRRVRHLGIEIMTNCGTMPWICQIILRMIMNVYHCYI